MNYKLLGKILGKIMIMESVLMLAPLLISIMLLDSGDDEEDYGTADDGENYHF